MQVEADTYIYKSWNEIHGEVGKWLNHAIDLCPIHLQPIS